MVPERIFHYPDSRTCCCGPQSHGKFAALCAQDTDDDEAGAAWLTRQHEYDLQSLGPWTFDEISSGYLIAPDPVSSGATHIWYSVSAGTFMHCGGVCIMFVGQHPQNAGRPEVDTLGLWLEENGGLDAVLERAGEKEVALIWDAGGFTTIIGVEGDIERVIDGEWVLHERDEDDGDYMVFEDI